jgi:uncharacterized membrane protein YeaQ/YmgE (transglycosylase-associated protein family)
MSNESLLVVILVGLIAGWLAGVLIRGSGFGLVGDIIVGWLGALIGHWLLPRLLIIRVLNGQGLSYRRRWGRRW